MTSVTHIDVLIVGAGPVGLAAAIELGMRGIRCLVVERNDRVGYAPRAKTTNVRTRTHMRRWGIADRLAAASPFGVDYPSNVVFTTRLGGFELGRIENAFNTAPARDPRYAEHAQWIPQYKLEEVLRAHASSLPTVQIRFDTTCAELLQDDEQVRVTLASKEGEESVEARYVIGADGARSTVRDIIKVKMSGRYGLSCNYNIIFRAPGLTKAHPHGPAIFYWQINPDYPSMIAPMDEGEIWAIGLVGLPEGTKLTDAQSVAAIQASTGIDLPYEILSAEQWVASRLIADSYRDRRVFLAGDACHLHPPFGGYGMNMGIGDGADLGWKLAATLQGWGGEALLDSYEIERRPVHEWIMDEAEANHSVLPKQLFQAGIEDDTLEAAAQRAEAGARIVQTKVREFHTLGAVLGPCYRNSPVISDDETSPLLLDAEVYTPSSTPGCLAPHIWLDDGTALYDHFGAGFTLLVRGTGHGESAAIAFANSRKIPFVLLPLPGAANDELYPSNLTLVRPDQHVCWRGDQWVDEVLLKATGNSSVLK